MLERTNRIWEADSSQPRAMASMITPCQPRRSMPPALGSHPRYTVKRRMSHNPTQKTGIDWPALANTLPTVRLYVLGSHDKSSGLCKGLRSDVMVWV
jgi:hypothetical protein